MSPPLSSLPFSAIQAMANEQEALDTLNPKQWFEKARHEADLAILAERKNKREETYLAYTRACLFYSNAKNHPLVADVKKKDPVWAARLKDFKENYEAYLVKAKEMRDVLKKRDAERDGSPASSSSHTSPTPKHSGPETTSMGSIADRMKALNLKGMDVGIPNKRMSIDQPRSIQSPATPPAPRTIIQSSGHPPPPPSAASASASIKINGTSSTSTRSRSSSQADKLSTRSRSSSLIEVKAPPSITAAKPIIPPLSQTDQSWQSTPPPSKPPPVSAPKPSNPPHAPQSSSTQSPTTAAGSSSRSPNPIESAASGLPPLPEVPKPTTATSPEIPDSAPGEDARVPSQSPKIIGGSIPSAGLDKPHLPRLPSGATNNAEPPSPGPRSALSAFEMAFPSLGDFSKQFDDDPAFTASPIDDRRLGAVAEKGSENQEDEDEDPSISFPALPSFPTLPSVPTTRPMGPRPQSSSSTDFPPPPARFEPPPDRAPSPPEADVDKGVQRPASQPNLTMLDGKINEGLDEDDPSTRPVEPPSLAPNRSGASVLSPPLPPRSVDPPTNGYHHRPTPSLSFPTPQPTPSGPPFPTPKPTPATSSALPPQPKPKFPFTSAIVANDLRTYFLNPSVDLVLFDVRSEEEFSRSHVGVEYEGRGAKVRVVWLDPTVLMRDGMNSTKLEDSLSLSPEAHRKAFESRHTFDLVVVYDSHSYSWPKKGSPPNPMSRLWDIIYDHEFTKKLQRNPVMLEGGYEAWTEFIKMRVASNMRLNGHRPGGSAATNGVVPMGPRDTNRQSSQNSLGESPSKRMNRDMPVYQSSQYARNLTDNLAYTSAQSMSTPYGNQTRYSKSPSQSYRPSSSSTYSTSPSTIAPPPQASIHPGPGVRRQSDYVEHHNQAYSGYMSPNSNSTRPSIDYPEAHALAVAPTPPPPTASHALERYDARPAVVRSGSIRGLDLVANQGDEVRYWNDVVLGLTGLKNFGSTCYMNSTIQCLSATYPFTSFFLDGSYKKAINVYNKLGTQGHLADAFSELLQALWKEDYTFLSPVTFRKNIATFASQFSSTNEQHDSQEFLSFVLDGLHEDLNRIKHRPPPVEMTPEREALLETLPPEVASEKEWQIYKQRNDSFIVDLFQGQYRNRLECLTCHKTSTTYDTFMYISLPIPAGRPKIVLQELIDEFIATEIMDGEDKWNCPRCKVPRRASKTLTLARLPPVLLIQLKRFTSQNGMFWDRSDANVIFPIKGLDLTRYVPPRSSRGLDLDDPRTQVGPFKYDLYGVSNHMGTLSSGHYTAYIKSAKGWKFAEDSRISNAKEGDIVILQASPGVNTGMIRVRITRDDLE